MRFCWKKLRFKTRCQTCHCKYSAHRYGDEGNVHVPLFSCHFRYNSNNDIAINVILFRRKPRSWSCRILWIAPFSSYSSMPFNSGRNGKTLTAKLLFIHSYASFFLFKFQQKLHHYCHVEVIVILHSRLWSNVKTRRALFTAQIAAKAVHNPYAS